MKLRGLILRILLSALALLVGGTLASAHTVRHHKAAHHHKRRHKKPKQQATVSVLPYMGPLPSPSVFGVNTGLYDTNQSYFQRDLPTARNIGARWVHFTGKGLRFFSNGQPDWRFLDSQVTQARQLGLGVLMSLGGTPTACSLSPRPASITACPPTTTADLASYATFLRAELIRYRNNIQYYESWLEPNGPGYWPPGANPAQYANLLRTQYQVFQSVNATYHLSLKLIFGGPISFGTAPGSKGSIAVLPFVDEVLSDLHGARVFDAIGLHGYRFPNPSNGPADENWGPSASLWDYTAGLGSFDPSCGSNAAWCTMTWPEELTALEQIFENHGYGQLPLWLTEFGWPGNATATNALYPSFSTQAQYLREAYDDILSLPFVQGAFWFNSRDYEPGISSSDPAFFYHYGLVQYNFTPKPALSLFETLAQANPGR